MRNIKEICFIFLLFIKLLDVKKIKNNENNWEWIYVADDQMKTNFLNTNATPVSGLVSHF